MEKIYNLMFIYSNDDDDDDPSFLLVTQSVEAI